MNWLQEKCFVPRPVVAIEDHVYHISELARNIVNAAPDFLSNATFVCLDRAGPDTDAAVLEWLESYPSLQVAARLSEQTQFNDHTHRVIELSDSVFKNQNDYCRQIASLIRPHGLLLQDIELETLEFVPRERWWESTMLASTVRGIIGDRAPRCAFISNKRGYEATFGAELLAAGHDPRDVLNKYDVKDVVVPFLTSYLAKHFPLQLNWSKGNNKSSGSGSQCLIVDSDPETQWIHSQLDVVLWPERDDSHVIGGLSFADEKKPIHLPSLGHEFETWKSLLEANLRNDSGVEVQTVGKRVAPSGALRAETTNAAARHIHSIRKRLKNAQDIVTSAGNYRLRDGLSVGIVTSANIPNRLL